MLSLWIQTYVRPPGRWSWTACLDRNDTDRTILSSAMPTAIVTGVMDLPASAFQPRHRNAVSAYSRAGSLRYRFKAPRYKLEQSTSNFGLYSMTDLRPLPNPIA